MRKIIIYRKPTTYSGKTKCFECFVVNDYQLRRLEEWFNPPQRGDAYYEAEFTIEEIL